MKYEKPSMVEIKMDAEIGSYQVDFVEGAAKRPRAPRRAPGGDTRRRGGPGERYPEVPAGCGI
jgi:hypothetical protein